MYNIILATKECVFRGTALPGDEKHGREEGTKIKNKIMASIDIIKRVAEEIANEAASLFLSGAGTPITNDENLDPTDQLGIIDELGNDTPAFRWVNAVLMFLRSVNGILNNSIERSELIEAADILTDLTENDL